MLSEWFWCVKSACYLYIKIKHTPTKNALLLHHAIESPGPKMHNCILLQGLFVWGAFVQILFWLEMIISSNLHFVVFAVCLRLLA